MKIKPLAMSLAASLFLLIPLLSPEAHGARIDLAVDHGVDKDAEVQARTAVRGIIDFFWNTYGISLQRNIRIKFSCDKLNYKKAIKKWYGSSEALASFEADNSLGLHRRGSIIIDLGDRSTRHGQIFILCHEIVHCYQGQESRDRHSSIRWISEGVANAIAAHILESVGVAAPGSYQALWRKNLQRVQRWPKLKNLHSRDQMRVAGAYSTAALAVLTLVRWKGYRPLFVYFRSLKNAGPEAAFYHAFGARLRDFEKQFRPDKAGGPL